MRVTLWVNKKGSSPKELLIDKLVQSIYANLRAHLYESVCSL